MKLTNVYTVFYETTGGVGERSKRALFSNKFGKLCMPYLLVEIHKAHKHTRGSEQPFLVKVCQKGFS